MRWTCFVIYSQMSLPAGAADPASVIHSRPLKAHSWRNMQVLYRVSVLDESSSHVQRCWKSFLLQLYILHSSACRVDHRFHSRSKNLVLERSSDSIDVYGPNENVVFWIIRCEISPT